MSKTVKSIFESVIAVFLIVAFYVAIFALVLYAPRLYDFVYTPKKTLNVYMFREIVADGVFEEFEKKTGIHLMVTYYASNEELLAKFKISRGRGYDLILPSDYMIEMLRQEGLLQPLDKSKISNISNLDARFLGKYFDPENKYSLPLCWTPYGIGFNNKEISVEQASDWSLIFEKNKNLNQKISMLNDARETIFLAAIYLFQDTTSFSDDRVEKIKQLLIDQKKYIECYTESGTKYLLLSQIVSAAVVPLTRMKEIVSGGENYCFALPRQGGLIAIDNVAIPVTAKKVGMAHQFIDFLLSKEVGVLNFDTYGSQPTNKIAYQQVKEKYQKNAAFFFPDDEMFKKFHLITNKLSTSNIEKLWLAVKAA